MTKKEAEKALEDGCHHNPWNDDVCGPCAKAALAAFRGKDGETKGCSYCGNMDHTSPEHASYMQWMGWDDEID